MSIVRAECPLCQQWIEQTCWLEEGVHDVWRLNVHGMFKGSMEPTCAGSMLTVDAAKWLADAAAPAPKDRP